MKAWKSAITCAALVSAIFASTPVVHAEGEMQAALKTIPGDVIGFVCVPSAEGLDGKIMKVAQTLGLAPMMPGSPLQLMKDYSGAATGLDGAGSITILMFKPKSADEAALAAATVMQLPTANAQTLMDELGAEAEVEGLRPLTRFGEGQYALARGKHVAIGGNKELLKKLQSADADISSRISGPALEHLSTLDVAVWVDVQKAGEFAKPMIDQFLQMMDTGGGPASIEAIQHKSMVKNVNMLTEGLDTAQMGLAVTPKGITTSFHLAAKEGTKLGGMFKDTPYSEGGLLSGLPADPYIFAGGQKVDAKAMKESWDDLNAILSADELKESCDADMLATVRTQLETLLTELQGGAVSITLLPESPEGLVGLTLAMNVSDASKWIDSFEKTVTAAKDVSKDEEAKEALSKLTFQKGAAMIDGVSAHKLAFDLPAVAELDPEDAEEMKKVLGKDGVMFYLAAADNDTVVMTFGGGEARLAEVIKVAKSGAAPLSDEASIKNVTASLPKKRSSEMYFAADRMFKLVENINRAVGEEPFPIRMAEVNAPIAIITSGGGLHVQMDVFLPMETVVAVKDTIMQAMFSGMMQQGGADDDAL